MSNVSWLVVGAQVEWESCPICGHVGNADLVGAKNLLDQFQESSVSLRPLGTVIPTTSTTTSYSGVTFVAQSNWSDFSVWSTGGEWGIWDQPAKVKEKALPTWSREYKKQNQHLFKRRGR
jgi:hypothetical protein